MKLKTQLFGKSYQFKDVKQVLAKANELRSGDVLAGVVAESSQARRGQAGAVRDDDCGYPHESGDPV